MEIRLNGCYIKYKLFLNILMQVSQLKSNDLNGPERKIKLYFLYMQKNCVQSLIYYSGKKSAYKIKKAKILLETGQHPRLREILPQIYSFFNPSILFLVCLNIQM